jgi:hypothetical protein
MPNGYLIAVGKVLDESPFLLDVIMDRFPILIKISLVLIWIIGMAVLIVLYIWDKKMISIQNWPRSKAKQLSLFLT